MVNPGPKSDRAQKRLSYRWVLELLVNRPAIGLAVIGMLSAVFGFHLPSLAFRSSIYDLVVEDLPETTRYQVFKSIFGSEEIIRVVIKADDVFAPATFQKITQLSDAASQIEGVRRVVSLPEIKKAVDVAGTLDLPQFQALIAPVALFRKNLISEDRRVTALTLLLKSEADRQATILAVRQMISDIPKTLSAYQIGMPLVAEALAVFTERDFLRLPPITLSVMFLTLLMLYRNFAAVLLPIACVGLSLIWTFGLMAWLKTPLSMLTMIVPVFLIAVGSAYCLHVVSEHLACLKNSASPKQAVIETFTAVAFPSFLAVATTVVGLGSLFVNRIVSIHEFAFFSCAGMLSLLVILLVFLPSALAMHPLRNTQKPPLRFGRFIDGALNAIVRLSLRKQRATLAAIGAISVFCCIGLTFIRVETNPVDQFRADAPISRHFHDVYKDLSGSFPVNVVMDGRMEDYFEKPGNIGRLPALQTFLETLPGVDKTISFADYMMLVNYAINRYDPAYYALPKEDFEVRMVINNYKNILGDEMLSSFMSPDFSKTTVLLLTHLSSSVDFLKLKERILEHVGGHPAEDIAWEVTGFGTVIAASSHLLTLGQMKSFALTALFIFALMTVLFLSIKVGLIATLPNIFPILVVFGLMGWLGIRLSMVTSLVASIAIGLAVDDTIHYLVRYNREFKRDLNKDRAMRDTVRSVGRPIILTTFIICLGFSILTFSQFKPTATFGVLMVLTMGAALVGDLILLPALMLHVELVSAWDLLKRMPALEAMSANTAHELRQPLNAIRMGGDFLDMMLKRGEAIPHDILTHVTEEIGLQVDRATAIINRMSQFGQQPAGEPEAVDVNREIRDALEMVSHRMPLENVTVHLELAEKLPAVSAHSHRLGQVILNLLANAMEAIHAREKADGARNGGTIVIRTEVDGDRVIVSVEDTGIGIPEHHLDRVMEPFFTTKDASRGKGLGLSICSQIVKGYGGTIRARKKNRPGAAMEVVLPRADMPR